MRHAITLIGDSIHALHEESDDDGEPVTALTVISIHALHEESDFLTLYCPPPVADFNPRSP
mgnify:CR=1 FL=1